MNRRQILTDPVGQSVVLVLLALMIGLLFKPAGWAGVAILAGFAISGSF